MRPGIPTRRVDSLRSNSRLHTPGILSNAYRRVANVPATPTLRPRDSLIILTLLSRYSPATPYLLPRYPSLLPPLAAQGSQERSSTRGGCARHGVLWLRSPISTIHHLASGACRRSGRREQARAAAAVARRDGPAACPRRVRRTRGLRPRRGRCRRACSSLLERGGPV